MTLALLSGIIKPAHAATQTFVSVNGINHSEHVTTLASLINDVDGGAGTAVYIDSQEKLENVIDNLNKKGIDSDAEYDQILVVSSNEMEGTKDISKTQFSNQYMNFRK